MDVLNFQSRATVYGLLSVVCGLCLGKISMAYKPLPCTTINETNTASINSKIQITGIITGENGEPIPGASVIVLPSGMGLSTKEDGTFSVTLDPLKSSLKISAVGYEEKILESFDTLQPKIVLKQQARKLGEVVVTADAGKRLGGIVGGLMITRRYTLRDTLKNFFTTPNPAIRLYPNPVRPGGIVNVELKIKPGNYNLQLLDAEGRIIAQKQVRANTAKFIEQLRVEKKWTGGNYFIRVFDGKNKMVEGAGFMVL